jgi:hypothetical protein
MHRVMPARPFPPAYRTMPGIPVYHIDTSGMLLASKIITKPLCDVKRRFRECGLIEGNDQECKKPFCSQCLKKRDLGHKCYMSPLSNRVPRSDKILFIFYDFETTRDRMCVGHFLRARAKPSVRSTILCRVRGQPRYGYGLPEMW